MTTFCPAPDPALGIAIRLSNFMACESRALGENGFQAFAGGPIGLALLSGLLTIFVALIGYRLILGEKPDIRDGVSWMVRVGFVLALVTSWPAFQTLVFRVVVDGPNDIAAIVLPASGIPTDDLSARVQRAYDTLRLGAAFHAGPAQGSQAGDSAATQAAMYQSALPQTASLFVLSTTGIIGAFQIAVGFLLAVAPLPLMALLFDTTLSIFAGWVRALAGVALASLSAIIITATHLLVVESELAHLQVVRIGGADRVVDPQGLTTIVLIFLLTTLVTSFAAIRVASAFRLEMPLRKSTNSIDHASTERSFVVDALARHAHGSHTPRPSLGDQSRAAGVASAIASAIRREELTAANSRIVLISSQQDASTGERISQSNPTMRQGLGTASRRMVSRQTRSSARRDRAAQ